MREFEVCLVRVVLTLHTGEDERSRPGSRDHPAPNPIPHLSAQRSLSKHSSKKAQLFFFHFKSLAQRLSLAGSCKSSVLCPLPLHDIQPPRCSLASESIDDPSCFSYPGGIAWYGRCNPASRYLTSRRSSSFTLRHSDTRVQAGNSQQCFNIIACANPVGS